MTIIFDIIAIIVGGAVALFFISQVLAMIWLMIYHFVIVKYEHKAFNKGYAAHERQLQEEQEQLWPT